MLIELKEKISYKERQKNERGEMEEKSVETAVLDLDFESLTGRDLIAANKEAVKIEGPSISPILSQAYHAAVAARAAKVPLDAVMNLKAVDFTTVTMAVQDFLLNTGLKA